MKLGKLLGAGKSFFGWQGAVAYRANKRVYLPKFNRGPNPFAPQIAEPQPVAAAPVKVVSVATPLALEAEVAPEMPKPTPFSAPIPMQTPVRTPTWAEKLIPFRGAKPAKLAPPPPMPNLQPEFSLHAVKVVYNDLSDAEVEVVPMKSRPATPAPSVPAAGGSMDFLGEPVFKTI